jgi:hypothetical protein
VLEGVTLECLGEDAEVVCDDIILGRALDPLEAGIARAASTPMISTTIMISTRVKAARVCRGLRDDGACRGGMEAGMAG